MAKQKGYSLILEKGGTGTAEQQVRGLQDWWGSHNIPGQLQSIGLQDISGFGLPQQAALMQAFALAPEHAAQIVLDVVMGSGNTPVNTGGGQAKDLGTTSFNDMVRTFTPRFTGTGLGAAPQQFDAQGQLSSHLVTNLFPNSNWDQFMANARPSQNVEDWRGGFQNLIGPQNPPNQRMFMPGGVMESQN